jgi:hypothetical protein
VREGNQNESSADHHGLRYATPFLFYWEKCLTPCSSTRGSFCHVYHASSTGRAHWEVHAALEQAARAVLLCGAGRRRRGGFGVCGVAMG